MGTKRAKKTMISILAGCIIALHLTAAGYAAPVPEEELPVAEVDVTEVEVEQDSFSRQLAYTTYDQNSDAKRHLPETVEANGETYKLVSAEKPLVVERTGVDPATKTVTGGEFRDGETGHDPQERIKDEDGTEFRLSRKTLIDHEAEPRTEHKTVALDYKGLEAGITVPEEHETEVTDSLSGQTVKATLRKTNTEVVKEYWSDDFVFPITISNYDADVFYLGNKEIPKDADLVDYADAFLSYLGLDSGSYEVQSIEWDGEPFSQGGQLMRSAVGKGRKLVRDIKVTYEGDVELPPVASHHWECVYEEVIPENMSILYTMTVNATYERVQAAAVKEKGFFEKLVDGVVGLITAAYEAVAVSFEEHPVVSSIPIVLVAGLIAFFVIKKKRNRCLYDEKVRCPYKKRGQETCKTCVHYQNRQQIS